MILPLLTLCVQGSEMSCQVRKVHPESSSSRGFTLKGGLPICLVFSVPSFVCVFVSSKRNFWMPGATNSWARVPRPTIPLTNQGWLSVCVWVTTCSYRVETICPGNCSVGYKNHCKEGVHRLRQKTQIKTNFYGTKYGLGVVWVRPDILGLVKTCNYSTVHTLWAGPQGLYRTLIFILISSFERARQGVWKVGVS